MRGDKQQQPEQQANHLRLGKAGADVVPMANLQPERPEEGEDRVPVPGADTGKSEGQGQGQQGEGKNEDKNKNNEGGSSSSSSSSSGPSSGQSSTSNLSPSKALELPPAIQASPNGDVLESVGERRNRLPPLAGASIGLASNRRLSAPVVLREQREQILAMRPVRAEAAGGGEGGAVTEEKVAEGGGEEVVVVEGGNAEA